MKTFFIRHSSALDIDHETFNHLWDNHLIAVHYPISKYGWNEKDDCDSIDPNDYTGSAKKALNALHKLSEQGGYIFSVYEHQNLYKIGRVEPGTPIELIKGNWGNKNKLQGRKAMLKGLKMAEHMELNPIEALSLTCAQPRQGTICVWHKIGQRVEHIINETTQQKNLSDLTPDLQEVLCSEFLRTGLDPSLPKLSSLLMPVGRTMKDIDIIGLSEDNKRALVQVTYSFEPQWKIDKLKKYGDGSETALLLFCMTDNPRIQDGVRLYSIEEAFNRYSDTPVGQNWLKHIR
jgi:hypothetical protein